MDSLVKEIEKIEKRLNTIAEENSLLYEINEMENYNLAINKKYSKIKINVSKQLK